jgi:triosephosphate isomerase
MKKIIICNWKANPATVQTAVKLAEGVDGAIFRTDDAGPVVVAPPHVFLDAVGETLEDAMLGAQDAFWGGLGAYTGATSWKHLRSLGVKYVILGHSERRAYFKEENEDINKRIKAVLLSGMTAVLCVGEPDRTKRTKRWIRAYVKKQVVEALVGVPKKHANKLIVAYEPVWAIGKKKGDTPEDADEMAFFIKEVLSSAGYGNDVRVLYGGSVNKSNAKGFLLQKHIDGALVGGASLRLGEFRKIIEIASKI